MRRKFRDTIWYDPVLDQIMLYVDIELLEHRRLVQMVTGETEEKYLFRLSSLEFAKKYFITLEHL